MQEMTSSIKTTRIPFNTARAIGEAGKQERREVTGRIAPEVSIEGVPGEYDFRKFLTAPFEGMVPVQNSFGKATVNSLAVSTNKESWESTETHLVHGLYGPVSRGTDRGKWYTDLSNYQEGDPAPTLTTFDDGRLPSRAVVSGATTPQPASIKLVQETDTW